MEKQPHLYYFIKDFCLELIFKSAAKEEIHLNRKRIGKTESVNNTNNKKWKLIDKSESNRIVKITLSNRNLKTKLNIETINSINEKSLNQFKENKSICNLIKSSNEYFIEQLINEIIDSSIKQSTRPPKPIITISNNEQFIKQLIYEIIDKSIDEQLSNTLIKDEISNEEMELLFQQTNFFENEELYFGDDQLLSNLTLTSNSAFSFINNSYNNKCKNNNNKYNNKSISIKLKASNYFNQVVIPVLVSKLDFDLYNKIHFAKKIITLNKYGITNLKQFQEIPESTFVTLVRKKILKSSFKTFGNNSALHYFLKNEVRNYTESEIRQQLIMLSHEKVLNRQNSFGETPLITLFKYNNKWEGSFFVALLLLANNPDVNITDYNTSNEDNLIGLSAIDYSIMYDYQFNKALTQHLLLVSFNYKRSIISFNTNLKKKYFYQSKALNNISYIR